MTLRVLMAHAYFRQRGGEDRSFESEARLLAEHGHDVRTFVRDNRSLSLDSVADRVGAVRDAVWSRKVASELSAELSQFRPDVVHVQNFFPSLSPSVIAAAADAGIPVIYSLRDYRLACPMGQFFRDGQVCEDCVGSSLSLPGIRHGCYRGSRSLTGVVASMSAVAKARGVWDDVTTFVALSVFAKRKFVEIGLPAEKITVKPNFVLPDPGARTGSRDHLLYVGRLSPEKGVLELFEALRGAPAVPLEVMGEGPLEDELRHRARAYGLSVRFRGFHAASDVFDAMGRARAVLVPSRWYETFGRVVVEAYACATPVIATRIGALEELILDGETGFSVPPEDPGALASAIRTLWDDPAVAHAMGRRARSEFERKFTADVNYEQLVDIYRGATARV